jgi:hypothetical protein
MKKIDFDLSPEKPCWCWVANKKMQMKDVEFDMHYSLEMGVVLEGKMERYNEDQKYVLKPGDMWFCGVWNSLVPLGA